ncbi:hypothetical protein EQW78_06270 [Oerskovia turbata]|uniref:Uncharacterized protein n=1 Tax=Oerskovia turbata TaxID=1713 RepID=A0A4Q1KZ71_9CELL|nr:hypothetical protein [Oerskovia turbata]RXR25059.1 hypothetical protein EQW73_12300 [Oerskovia turbata]RXR35205.1 hypothetical protein EQW78_06270 [Oerskovia turbata]TGJ94719.1 hypothetical protein DLJ96_18220 [Actinotalea fermentans ATCC 43279 = JCM 9966 = DSM 3133]
MTSLRRLAPAVSLVALLALTACGTDTDSGGNTSDTPSAEESTADETTPADESPEAPLDAADLPIEAGANGVDLPAGIDAPTALGVPGAAWTAQDGYLYVVTFGSSTCPHIAEGDATLDGSDVVVTFQKVDETKPCTMDLRPWTTVVKAPEGVDESADVTVRLDEAGSVVLTPRAAAGQVGEAAWVAQS